LYLRIYPPFLGGQGVSYCFGVKYKWYKID
jgi:hypothetical protein